MVDVTNEQMGDLSDEEIMNMSYEPKIISYGSEPAQPEEPVVEEAVIEPEVKVGEDEPDINKEDGAQEEAQKEKTEEEVGEENPLNQSDDDFEKAKPAAKSKEEPKKEAPIEPAKAEETPAGEEPVVEAPNYEEAYKKIMGPIKASGKTIQLQSPEEAVALIQKGFDYTKRMQSLKPALKMMKMLENNGLLDEAKITHMIDLDKKDPAALSKFLKDKQIDPLDLDLSDNAEYKPGNHTVTDGEMKFDTILKDVQSSPEGKEIVQIMDKEWDKESLGRVFAEPEILSLMNVHHSTGIYEQITSEMERLKVVGVIPEDTPFLDAYKSVGDELHKHGRLIVDGKPTNAEPSKAPEKKPETKPEGKPEVPPQKTTRQVFAERPATPKPAAKNDEAARAAGSTRSNPAKPTSTSFNPLLMSDEEFEQQAGNLRL